jgi:hypothetical protein
MKKSYLIFLFFVTSIGYSQSNGISYQAALLNPKSPQQTGQNSSYVPLLDKNVCLRFEIRNAANQLEYQETQGTKTDAFGMVNLIIGKGSQTAGTAADFNSIIWNSTPKKLVVALDTEGNCSSFIEISNQDLTGVPFAFSAQNAQNVIGVVPITNGGTGATTAADARKNLGLENLNNTSDTNKPVSIATQTALDLKAPLISPTFTGTVSGIDKAMVGLSNADNTSDASKPISSVTQAALDLKESVANKSTDIAADANSSIKYPTVKSIKDYIDSQSSTGTVADATISNKGKIQLAGDLTGTATAPIIANNAVTDAKVANGISASKVGLGNVDNTSDASKPISTATQAALDLKAPLASPTFTGTVSGIDKTMIGLANVDDTSDLNKPISAFTQAALDLKQNALTNPVTGIGTVNSIPKFSGALALGNSNISDNGTVVSVITDATLNGLSIGRGPGNFDNNTVFGKSALSVNTAGINNTAIGFESLFSNTTGESNTAIGINALRLNTLGKANVAIGINALINNTTGNNNTAVGAGALVNSTGSNNVALGLNSFINLSSGSNNIALGVNAGRYAGSGTTTLTSTNNSIYLGFLSRGLNASGSTNEIVIGNDVVGLGSNTTVLGNSATTKAAIYGNLQVNGAYTNASSNNEGTDTTIDFSLSNIAHTSSPSISITLTNIKDGGTYYLALTATTVNNKVTFTVPVGFTLHDMGTTDRINGNMHLYRFVVAGTNVFVTMATGI